MTWVFNGQFQKKKQSSGGGDMKFPGVSKKEHVKFPGVTGISKSDQEKNSVEFPEDLVYGPGIFKGSKTIL